MLKVERVSFPVAVERSIIHQSDHDSRWELTGKQFLMVLVSVMLNFKRLLVTAQNTPFDTRALPFTSLVSTAVYMYNSIGIWENRIISDFDQKL